MIKRILSTDEQFYYLKKNYKKILDACQGSYKTTLKDIGLSQENIKRVQKLQESSSEIILADIDQDGFLLTNYGEILYAPLTTKREFLRRNRYDLKIIYKNGYVGVKKSYNSNKTAFLNEIQALYLLGKAGCNVPGILDIDYENLSITITYISGSVLREELAKKGAIIRDRDIQNHPDIRSRNTRKRFEKQIEEAKRVLYKTVDANFVDELYNQLKKIHSVRIILNDIKYGNIIIEHVSNKPFIIDFEAAHYYPSINAKMFTILRSQNIKQFNLLFNTNYKIE